MQAPVLVHAPEQAQVPVPGRQVQVLEQDLALLAQVPPAAPARVQGLADTTRQNPWLLLLRHRRLAMPTL
ncbi:hypothetical protein LJR066_003112 [Acidovorax sp. LjRoot66]|uniref:hypothetical protein n=1 Tax=Acidovorax sp. LjRoot66 TaxID=3342334 RepID=UPI003ECC31D0